jgi:uncharacterized protein YjbJ (UPF0337 family)
LWRLAPRAFAHVIGGESTGGQRIPHRKDISVGLDDKMKNKAEEAAGKAKEEFGDLTDNERLEAEGRGEQAEAKVKQAGEHVKDTVDDVKDAFRR